jgi:thiamine kinase-like enzyme
MLRAALEAVPARVASLRTSLAGLPGAPSHDVVFAHGDLQHMNILGGVGDIMLIDYEYALSAPRAYDIANHFCERAADYSDGERMLDFGERYPTRAQREAFCAAYLAASSGRQPTELEVTQLAAAADCYALASHLSWALWGVIQSVRSSVAWDFLGYSMLRFAEYEAHAARLEAERAAGG